MKGRSSTAILDVSRENRDLNAAAVMAGPKTIDALIEKFLACAQALRDGTERSRAQ